MCRRLAVGGRAPVRPPPPAPRAARRPRRRGRRPTGRGSLRPAAHAALGVSPVRPPALPQHRRRPRRRRGGAALAAPGLPAHRPGSGHLHRLQSPVVCGRPPPGHGPGVAEAGQRGLCRGPARRLRQLPQLRQSGAPRGHVAALGVDRRTGRVVPGPGAPGDRRQRSLYNASAGTDIDPTPVLGVLGVVEASSGAAGAPAGSVGDAARPPRGAGGGGRVVPPGGDPLGHRAAGPPLGPGVRRRLGAPRGAVRPSWRCWWPRRVGGAADPPLLHAVHDVSGGGLAVALADMVAPHGGGLRPRGGRARPSCSPSSPRVSSLSPTGAPDEVCARAARRGSPPPCSAGPAATA